MSILFKFMILLWTFDHNGFILWELFLRMISALCSFRFQLKEREPCIIQNDNNKFYPDRYLYWVSLPSLSIYIIALFLPLPHILWEVMLDDIHIHNIFLLQYFQFLFNSHNIYSQYFQYLFNIHNIYLFVENDFFLRLVLKS